MRRSVGGIVQSDVGSLYRGGNMEEDALSQFMGQSQIGAGDDLSMMGGQPTGYGGGMMQLKPPAPVPAQPAPPAKRSSQFKRASGSTARASDTNLPPRGAQRATAPETKNYGSFLDGFGKAAGGSRGNTLDTRKVAETNNVETKS
jgi:hypothetical protein